MADLYQCTAKDCGKRVTATKNMRYRSHKRPDGESCENGSVEIPERELRAGPVDPDSDPAVPEEGRDYAVCPECTRRVRLTSNDYYEHHDSTLRGGERCPKAGTRYRVEGKVRSKLKPTENVPLPGDELPAKGVLAQQRPEVSDTTEGRKLAAPATRASTESAEPGLPAEDAATASGDALLTPEEFKSYPSVAPGPENPTAAANLARQPMEPRSLESRTVHPGPDEDEQWAAHMRGEDEPRFRQPTELSPELMTTSSPWDELIADSTSSDGTLVPLFGGSTGLFLQPGSPFLQPGDGKVPSGELSPDARDLATRIKETFYAYSNRKTKDNRSAQTTLGPSEIGTPCDRRLALTVMGVPPVNPGGDGWAAFVGTCTHGGMEDVYRWADAGTGRYAVEIRLTFGSVLVPYGTSDLLDRKEGDIVDWKVMGEYSLKKFKAEGPSDTYRIQAHTYGYGAEQAGEKVRRVNIVGLPRAGSSLDSMHVWSEPYDRDVAKQAIARVEAIYARTQQLAVETGALAEDSTADLLRRGREFDTATPYECRFCPFYLKGDKEGVRGCSGPKP